MINYHNYKQHTTHTPMYVRGCVGVCVYVCVCGGGGGVTHVCVNVSILVRERVYPWVCMCVSVCARVCAQGETGGRE